MVDLHDLAAAYVLDALDSDEVDLFEEHLHTCASCQAEVADLGDPAADIAASASEPPPSRVKAAVMAAIADDVGESNVVPMRTAKPVLAWTLAAAAAVLAVVFFGLWTVSSNELDLADQIAAVYEAPDSTTIDLDGATGPARLVYSASLGQGVFNGSRLGDLGDDEVYQLWLIGVEISSAGVLEPGEVVLVEDVSPGLTFAMTIEPAPGVEAPTTEPLFGTEL